MDNPFIEPSQFELSFHVDNPSTDRQRRHMRDLAMDAEFARISREFARRKATDLTYFDSIDNLDPIPEDPQLNLPPMPQLAPMPANEVQGTFARDLETPFDDTAETPFDPSGLGEVQPIPTGDAAFGPLEDATLPSAESLSTTQGAMQDMDGSMIREALRRMVRAA